MSDSSAGFTVDLLLASSFKGKELSGEKGWKEHQGQCASGIQYVF
ncbi:MAG: hypothetical protein WD894_01985 [Pirellulales bacterium]